MASGGFFQLCFLFRGVWVSYVGRVEQEFQAGSFLLVVYIEYLGKMLGVKKVFIVDKEVIRKKYIVEIV